MYNFTKNNLLIRHNAALPGCLIDKDSWTELSFLSHSRNFLSHLKASCNESHENENIIPPSCWDPVSQGAIAFLLDFSGREVDDYPCLFYCSPVLFHHSQTLLNSASDGQNHFQMLMRMKGHLWFLIQTSKLLLCLISMHQLYILK